MTESLPNVAENKSGQLPDVLEQLCRRAEGPAGQGVAMYTVSANLHQNLVSPVHELTMQPHSR